MATGGISRLAGDRDGQAAVESAMVLPLSLFVILGTLQVAMMQQARMLADYAAYKGARAASVGRLECEGINKAEIAALVPTLGRADSADTWVSTYNRFSNNRRNGLPVVFNDFKVTGGGSPSFDTPLTGNQAPAKLHLQVHYFYEMNIPFANWLIARYFLAERGLESWANMADPINPVARTETPPHRSSSADAVIAQQYFSQGHFVVPLRASWSFRMFSAAAKKSGSCQ